MKGPDLQYPCGPPFANQLQQRNKFTLHLLQRERGVAHFVEKSTESDGVVYAPELQGLTAQVSKPPNGIDRIRGGAIEGTANHV